MKLYRRVGLYYIISAITVAINLAVYGWLVYGLGINYLVAATGGFVLENVLDYVGERAFVFRMTHVRPAIGYLRSLSVAIIILVLILGLTYLGRVLGMNYMWARIFAGIIAGAVNYILDAKVTFVVRAF